MERLRKAAVGVFSRPAFYWALAAVFWLRVAILVALTPRRIDAESMWEGANAYLHNPSHMYDAAASSLERLHIIPLAGGLDAFVSPPAVAALGAPVALLPKQIGVQVWTAIDVAAMLLALFILYRTIGSRHRLAKPLFWLGAGYFPPVFADLVAGQRGGVLLVGAMASIWLEKHRPAVAGAVGGLAAALKYYPAAMIIGPRPAHRFRYAIALGATAVVVTSLSFIPLGPGGAISYYQHVLLPSLASHNTDCAYDSVRTLFTRTVGDEGWTYGAGTITLPSPLHSHGLALFLSYLSALLFAGGAVWAAWRSGWNPPYGMSLGFALGALIPNEVWPYQWLPLLPLILLLAVRALEQRRALTLGLLAVFLLGFVRQPCDLFFPNLWTLAAIAIFVLGLWENRIFRTSS